MPVITQNKSLIEKADLALSDLTNNGEIVPAQARRFIRLLVKPSVVMSQAFVRPMGSKKQKINTARFGSRIMRPGAEATALPLGDRSKPDLTEVELSAELFKAQVDLNDEVLEDNIEGGNFRQTVMSLIGEAASRDMEELLVQGDTASADAYLAIFDGLLKAATTNTVAAGTVPLSKTELKATLKAMPSEFSRNRRRLRYFTSVNAEIDYRDTLANRATAEGDRFLQDQMNSRYSGIPVQDVPLFPENLGGGTNETNLLLTDPKNVAIGIWRRIRMEVERDAKAGVLSVVVTIRWHFKYVHEPAVVKTTEILAA